MQPLQLDCAALRDRRSPRGTETAASPDAFSAGAFSRAQPDSLSAEEPLTRLLGFVPLRLHAVPVHLHAARYLFHCLQHLPPLLLLCLIVEQQLFTAAAPQEGVGTGEGRRQRFVVLLPARAPATAKQNHTGSRLRHERQERPWTASE